MRTIVKPVASTMANLAAGTEARPVATDADDARLFSNAEAERIIDRVVSLCPQVDTVNDGLWIEVHSMWAGRQRWARNRAVLTSNVRSVVIDITLGFSGGWGGPRGAKVQLNQVDDTSLRDACRYLGECRANESRAGYVPGIDLALGHPTWPTKGIPVWSDASYHRNATDNAQLVADMTARAETEGLLGSGSIDTAAAQYMGYFRDFWGRVEREQGVATMAECSTTVRHANGVGSGWAGASSFDLQRIDLAKLGETAFDKCMKSLNPVRIEPGRYQTIMEPDAVASFANIFVGLLQARDKAEAAGHPLYLDYDNTIQRGRSKLGLQIADRRLNISHNPENPLSGTHPSPGMRTVEYLTNGVITEMGRNYEYSLDNLGRGDLIPQTQSFVMSGSETMTREEIIATTKRGLLLTRVSNVELLDFTSQLHTGVTRDGLWLVENGKITKAVRNFRWTESPLFVFNNIESIGAPVPVMTSWAEQFPFHAHVLQAVVSTPVVPTLKINDFSFTSTVDAV